MDYAARLARLRTLLSSHACEAILIEHPIDLLYLTGLELSTGKLAVSQHQAHLIVDGRYFDSSQRQTLYPVIRLDDTSLKEWIHSQQIQTLGFDSYKTSHRDFLGLQHLMQAMGLQTSALIPLDSPIQQLRVIKEADEIAYLRQAAHLGYQGYELVFSLLEEGITENELAFELEFFWKKKGAKKLAFDPIIAFGANSAMPHYRAGPTALTSNTAVLIDIGVVYQHYHSDMTRVVYFGTPPATIRTIYPIVEEAKQRALDLCRPGALIGEIDQAARSFIASQGFGECFTHSLGHGVGLEIHESPILRGQGPYSTTPLKAGMVITIEPGIYLKGIGGVRLEDTILITESGYDNLTIS